MLCLLQGFMAVKVRGRAVKESSTEALKSRSRRLAVTLRNPLCCEAAGRQHRKPDCARIRSSLTGASIRSNAEQDFGASLQFVLMVWRDVGSFEGESFLSLDASAMGVSTASFSVFPRTWRDLKCISERLSNPVALTMEKWKRSRRLSPLLCSAKAAL